MKEQNGVSWHQLEAEKVVRLLDVEFIAFFTLATNLNSCTPV